MNLKDYEINEYIYHDEKVLEIFLNGTGFFNLELLLAIVQAQDDVDSLLDKLNTILSIHPDIDNIVNTEYDGYWNEGLLSQNGLVGDWYTIFSDDLGIVGNLNKQNTQIQLIDFKGRSEFMEISFLIDVLMQWKEILVEYGFN